MSEFQDRERMSLEDAKKACKLGGYIKHILDNQDGTYSLMGHINCEHCDYCDESNEWWESQKNQGLNYEEICKLNPIHLPKEDPYERQKVKCPENYGLISDGYQTWSGKCPTCNQWTMEVVRPGKVQCSNCG